MIDLADDAIDAFISALILIAGHICPVTSVDFNLEPLQESWMKSIAILRRHEIQMPSCKRAIAFLEVLKAQVCHTHDSNSRDLTDQRMQDLFVHILTWVENANDTQTGKKSKRSTTMQIPQRKIYLSKTGPSFQAWIICNHTQMVSMTFSKIMTSGILRLRELIVYLGLGIGVLVCCDRNCCQELIN